MLKIKDNIDLKELEKFGFEEYTIDGRGGFGYTLEVCDNKKDDEYSSLYVYPIGCPFERRLLIECNQESVIADTLLDLINAGLVEKEGKSE